ncbi:PAS domain-containing protein [Hansschlegelia plantiphila]|uniref:PAS domain-containing protein n=1 Tax=Hansschlegelia plantiphila TaxID=374655 RepID=UPI003D177A62
MSHAIDFSQIVASAGDAIVVSEASGVLAVWNQAAQRVFGFSEAETVGRSLDLITPERRRKRCWLSSGETTATREPATAPTCCGRRARTDGRGRSEFEAGVPGAPANKGAPTLLSRAVNPTPDQHKTNQGRLSL